MQLVIRWWPINQLRTGGGRDPVVWQVKLVSSQAINESSAPDILMSRGGTIVQQNKSIFIYRIVNTYQ